jgi:hypothetical protein
MAAIDNVVRRGWKYPFTQSCASCRTDWTVSAHFFGHATGGQIRLVVQTWRDLGDGKSPFEQAWRAHGVPNSNLPRSSNIVKNADMQPGDVRREFDLCNSGEVGMKMERATSPARARIYQAFMKKEGDGEVRRSRARPNVWRTRSENEEVERRMEEERREVARQVAENLVRLDEERRRRV